jgi:hypothetical protein
VPRMFFPNTTSNYKGALLQDELRGPLPGFAGNEFGPLGVSFWQSAAIFGYPRKPLHSAAQPFLISVVASGIDRAPDSFATKSEAKLHFRLGAVRPVPARFLECASEFLLNLRQPLHVCSNRSGEILGSLLASHDASLRLGKLSCLYGTFSETAARTGFGLAGQQSE